MSFGAASLSLLSGCTRVVWSDPARPDGPPIFSYYSGRDTSVQGLSVKVEYFESGAVRSIDVQLGGASGIASAVVDSYGEAISAQIEAIVKGAVEAMKVSQGIPP